MIQALKNRDKKISITGLGYVGLQLAVAFAKHFAVIGFDIDRKRVDQLQNKMDHTGELDQDAFEGCDLRFTHDPDDLKQAHFHIIAVPTDIDEYKTPDLKPLLNATLNIGHILKPGDVVVFESTVYPGCTEEECLPVLVQASGLKAGVDFKYGYSPERINPNDKERRLQDIQKIVSGNDAESLKLIGSVYSTVINAGLHYATSIKVAEAAKAIENTQRDINISFINEMAILFDKIGINTSEVIEAASTKWNFHSYQPGLVGGHCISVDPFYLIHKARQVDFFPQLIAAGRNVNDFIPHFIAKKVVQTLIEKGKNPGHCRVLVMGVTFKENVPDISYSKVIDMVRELNSYSISLDLIDPYADSKEVEKRYGLLLKAQPDTGVYDAVIVAVGHQEFRALSPVELKGFARDELLLFDIKGVYKVEGLDFYWKL